MKVKLIGAGGKELPRGEAMTPADIDALITRLTMLANRLAMIRMSDAADLVHEYATALAALKGWREHVLQADQRAADLTAQIAALKADAERWNKGISD